MLNVGEIMLRARQQGVGIPAFNIPYLPMMQPVCQAVKDADAFSLIEVARLEWTKFESGSLAAVAEAFRTGDQLNAQAIEDMLVVVHYSVTRVDT